jgi:hypothetical protein
MRTKALIKGFKNSQRVRVIFSANASEHISIYLTIKQIYEMLGIQQRFSVMTALERLANDRIEAKRLGNTLPIGLVCDDSFYRQIQVDLV